MGLAGGGIFGWAEALDHWEQSEAFPAFMELQFDRPSRGQNLAHREIVHEDGFKHSAISTIRGFTRYVLTRIMIIVALLQAT